MAAEQSFPVSEGFSSSFSNLLLKLFTVILIQLSSPFIKNNWIWQLFLIYIVLSVISVVLIALVRESHKRRRKDELIL